MDSDWVADSDDGRDSEADAPQPVRCNWSEGVEFLEPVELAHLNTEDSEHDPVLSVDWLTLTFVSPSATGERRLWKATRPTLGAPFGPKALADPFNGRTLFESVRESESRLVVVTSTQWPGSAGLNDIWYSERSTLAEPYGEWIHLAGAATEEYEFDPFISGDGLTLIFQRGLPGVRFDLFFVERDRIGASFGTPRLVEGVESIRDAQSPSLTSDGLTLVFSSNEFGDYDVLFATRETPDVPFGPSSRAAIPGSDGALEFEPFVRGDGCEIFFVRDDRAGTGWDVYQAVAR